MTPDEAGSLLRGTKVMFDAEVWDFGYVGQDGHCILYVEGECNMQDAVAARPDLVELETVARRRMARFAAENPELPPGWEWHPWNDRDDVHIRWRALGPRAGRQRMVAHGEFKHEDTPQGAADKAWKIWERLSGISREAYQRPPLTGFLGCWPSRCPRCGCDSIEDNSPPSCWWDHDGNCSQCGEHPFTASTEELSRVDGIMPDAVNNEHPMAKLRTAINDAVEILGRAPGNGETVAAYHILKEAQG